jgi:hypothetical protein
MYGNPLMAPLGPLNRAVPGLPAAAAPGKFHGAGRRLADIPFDLLDFRLRIEPYRGFPPRLFAVEARFRSSGNPGHSGGWQIRK